MGGEGIAGIFAFLLMLVVCTVMAIKEGGEFIAIAIFFWFIVAACIVSCLPEGKSKRLDSIGKPMPERYCINCGGRLDWRTGRMFCPACRKYRYDYTASPP